MLQQNEQVAQTLSDLIQGIPLAKTWVQASQVTVTHEETDTTAVIMALLQTVKSIRVVNPQAHSISYKVAIANASPFFQDLFTRLEASPQIYDEIAQFLKTAFNYAAEDPETYHALNFMLVADPYPSEDHAEEQRAVICHALGVLCVFICEYMESKVGEAWLDHFAIS